MLLRTLHIFSCFFAFIIVSVTASAQRIAVLTVDPHQVATGVATPVQVDLDALTLLPDSVLNLYEVAGKDRVQTGFQIQHGQQRSLTWIIKRKEGQKKITYELHHEAASPSKHPMNAVRSDSELTLGYGPQHLLRYHYGMHYPAGVDSVFGRSGFIHPLWSPKGKVLTRITPPDHFHHYGLWNPWTQVEYKGTVYDCWNLNSRQGTVRFKSFVSVNEGEVFSQYQTVHDHIIMPKSGGEKVILKELQTVTVYRPTDQYYIADISIRLNCSDGPVILKEYRYGGLGFRATEQWNKDNSVVITSEGKQRKEADGSKARWCLIQGAVDNGQAGLVMMSSPTNYNHPEPLRVWPEEIFGRGDVYANFVPIRDMDWPLEPGKDYALNYRFLVFDGNVTPQFAEAAWQSFAHAPAVTVKKDKQK